MRLFARRRPSATTVIALIALAVGLGGTSYAATSLPRNSVGTLQLKSNAVTSTKVKNGSLLKRDFKRGQLPAGAIGPTGPAGAPGPAGPSDAYAGFKNGPVAAPSSLSTIATLNIPQGGNYVIFAKLWMFDNVNTSVLTDCTLVAGSDSDESRTMLEGNSGVVVAGAVIALNVVHNFAAAGAVALNCNGFGVNISINNIKITAIRVGNLTNNGI
ncbi:MAG TPA: hypothetical protein VEG40_08865 [Gaiellaceae bacterium]|nr:hypothetical protein [Gaiellaceae bacterium]